MTATTEDSRDPVATGERAAAERRMSSPAGDTVMRDVSHIINSSLCLAGALDLVSRRLAQVLEFDRFAVLNVDLGRDVYSVSYVSGKPVEGMHTWNTDSLSSVHERTVVESSRPLSANVDTLGQAKGGAAIAAAGLRTVLATPLVAEGRSIGVLSLATTRQSAYGVADLALAATAADCIAGAVRVAQLSAWLGPREAERMATIGAMVAGVAHELNNPLMTISGYSELLLSREIPPSVRRLVEKVNDDAGRAARVVSGLLSFARIRGAEKRYIEIGPVLRQAIDFKEYDFRLSGISVSVTESDEVPKAIIDENEITQVLLNILTNAEQAMMGSAEKTIPEQVMTGRVPEPRIDVAISSDPEAETLRVSVQDNGPEMQPAVLERIFEPFFTTKNVDQGTGLGLSISNEIVKRHDGRLWAERIPGVGSTFHIELPVI